MDGRTWIVNEIIDEYTQNWGIDRSREKSSIVFNPKDYGEMILQDLLISNSLEW